MPREGDVAEKSSLSPFRGISLLKSLKLQISGGLYTGSPAESKNSPMPSCADEWDSIPVINCGGIKSCKQCLPE